MLTEKKNQHFIPKLYLRLFSINKKNLQIGLFYLPKEIYIKSADLKSQAKEDFFYGKDGSLEDDLSKLESLAAPSLKKIVETNILPNHGTDDYHKILTFSMIMGSRTKDSAEEINAMTDQMTKLWMQGHPEFTNEADKYTIRYENPAVIAVATTAKIIPVTFDLKIKLLVNTTTQPFITSDNPVIKYNQFLEQRKHFGGHVGLATKGLEIFFPISPTHMLCFYDDWIYKLGDKHKNVIHIANMADIDMLNSLQILNCFDHLYFNESISEFYLKQLCEKWEQKRILEYSQLKEVHTTKDEKGEGILYHGMRPNLQIKLQLSFIRQTKKAKHFVLDKNLPPLRNEKLKYVM